MADLKPKPENPGPWSGTYCDHHGTIQVKDANGYWVRNSMQNKWYVIHCINAYPRLVAALKVCMAHSYKSEDAFKLLQELGEVE